LGCRHTLALLALGSAIAVGLVNQGQMTSWSARKTVIILWPTLKPQLKYGPAFGGRSDQPNTRICGPVPAARTGSAAVGGRPDLGAKYFVFVAILWMDGVSAVAMGYAALGRGYRQRMYRVHAYPCRWHLSMKSLRMRVVVGGRAHPPQAPLLTFTTQLCLPPHTHGRPVPGALRT
jgi:hypothetical protein